MIKISRKSIIIYHVEKPGKIKISKFIFPLGESFIVYRYLRQNFQ